MYPVFMMVHIYNIQKGVLQEKKNIVQQTIRSEFFLRKKSHVIYLLDIMQEQQHPTEVPHFAAVAVPFALIIVLHLGAFFYAHHPLHCGLEREKFRREWRK